MSELSPSRSLAAIEIEFRKHFADEVELVFREHALTVFSGSICRCSRHAEMPIPIHFKAYTVQMILFAPNDKIGARIGKPGQYGPGFCLTW